MAPTAKQLADMNGLAVNGDYATPVGDPAKVQALIDLIQPEYTLTQRGFLDQISPQAQRQLLVELTALKAAVT